MTDSLDARTPSAAVHALSGSSAGAGRPFAPLATVHELPDSFVPLGAAAVDVVAGLAASRAAAAHPDAAVIALAGRLAALVPRQDRVLGRAVTIDSRIDQWDFDNRPQAPARRPSRMVGTDISTATHRVLQFSRSVKDDEEQERQDQAYVAACKVHGERKRRKVAGSRLPYLRRLADRMWTRMCRWAAELAEMEPHTYAGHAAKAAAALALGTTARDTGWVQCLATSVSRDAVRLAGGAMQVRLSPDSIQAATVRNAAVLDSDAELIELAEHVRDLAKRDHDAWDRCAEIEDAASEMLPPPPAAQNLPDPIVNEGWRADGSNGPLFDPPDHGRRALALDAEHKAALAGHERLRTELHERLGLPRQQKLTQRMFRRLIRWSERLTALEPRTLAGLRAKAEAYAAVEAAGNSSDWTTDFAASVSHDALRIAEATSEPRDDAALFDLLARHGRARADWDVAEEASEAPHRAWRAAVPPIPPALVSMPTDGSLILLGRRPATGATSGVVTYDHLDIERLRAMPEPTRSDWRGEPAPRKASEQVGHWVTIPDERLIARRAEILAALEAWETEKAAIAARVGLTAANARTDAAARALNDVEDAAIAHTPRTLAGLQAKARWIVAAPNSVKTLDVIVRDLCAMPVAAFRDDVSFIGFALKAEAA